MQGLLCWISGSIEIRLSRSILGLHLPLCSFLKYLSFLSISSFEHIQTLLYWVSGTGSVWIQPLNNMNLLMRELMYNSSIFNVKNQILQIQVFSITIGRNKTLIGWFTTWTKKTSSLCNRYQWWDPPFFVLKLLIIVAPRFYPRIPRNSRIAGCISAAYPFATK